MLLIMSLLGLSYNLKIMSLQSEKGQISRIKDIPGSKTILITIAWGIVTCLLPAMKHQSGFMSVTMACLFVMALVFARTAFFDILAIQGDRITGKETLPILLGEKRSFTIIQYVLLSAMGIIILSSFTGIFVQKALFFVSIPLILLLLILFFKNNSLISGVHREFVIECLFLATGVMAAVI